MRKFLLATISIAAMSIAGAAFAQSGAAGAGAAAGSSVGGSTSGTSAGVGGSGAIGISPTRGASPSMTTPNTMEPNLNNGISGSSTPPLAGSSTACPPNAASSAIYGSTANPAGGPATGTGATPTAPGVRC
jgi:hypothetical protein